MEMWVQREKGLKFPILPILEKKIYQYFFLYFKIAGHEY